MQLRINGTQRQVDGPLNVSGLLETLGLSGHMAVAVGGEIVPRTEWDDRQLGDGQEVEIVRPVSGGEADDEPLVIAGRNFRSRLFLGSGKHPSPESFVASLEASGTEMVTVAIRYMDLDNPKQGNILSQIDLNRYQLLPNTAGAYTAEQAVRMAVLARESTGTNWIKLEVIGDQDTLWPDAAGTVEAARLLVKQGFVVLPYISPDLVAALRLEDAGCAAVMPLASLIGSGQGFIDWRSIERIVGRVKVPVVVDAGIGVPSDAAMAMELGADAVLVNTAIAKAKHPPLMAAAMAEGVRAGRNGFLAGRMATQPLAAASSPTVGVPRAAHEVE